ncbi:MAG TPA: lipid II flippase MurJ, partial [Dehalococcoidia bacterium]|nr:lipid II flippase MurJ [Dehalococcoidia bacterium]
MREVSRRGAMARFLQRSTTSQSVAAAASIVAFGFVASRLLGLLRSVAIAHAFGTDPELSAYWVAFRLPDLVFQVLAGATLSAAFIPTYSRVRLRYGEQAGWDLASAVLNLISIATTLAAVLAFLLAPLIVPLLAPGLGAETGREAELRSLAVELTRVMLLSPILFGVSGMVTGILNARSHFLAPSLAPVFYNLAIIVAALFLAGPWGVKGLAAGVVVGSALHLLVQLPALRMVGMRWRPTFDIVSAGVSEVARLMGPRVIGLAAAQLNFVVVVFFAS